MSNIVVYLLHTSEKTVKIRSSSSPCRRGSTSVRRTTPWIPASAGMTIEKCEQLLAVHWKFEIGYWKFF